MEVSFRTIIFFSYICFVTLICAERTHNKQILRKLLREMVNQTKADTLNLPANATSIRENITDTFSCENRTYGYYADVDNECQVFHVCLNSQTSSGRNITYRWSFICPYETIFNQEVLTCTRPRDAIECEDSPMFYDVNMDIGKIPNDTDTQANPGDNTNMRRNKPIKKQNLIVKKLMKEVKKANLVVETLDDLAPVVEEVINEENNKEFKETDAESIKEVMTEEAMKKPVIHKVNEKYTMKGKRKEDSRLVSERNLKRSGRKLSRGTFRFKADRFN